MDQWLDWSRWLPQLRVLGEVTVAMLLGALIGYERQRAQRPAGFRTHMLVAGAAAMLVGLAMLLAEQAQARLAGDARTVGSDPVRVIEAVVTGVSFLGAGTIFRHAGRDHVMGLTTAASLLLSAAVGIAVALWLPLLAIGVTLLTLVVLGLLRRIEVARPAPPLAADDDARPGSRASNLARPD
jgi:putative Mg2+ transporter-C (MgtC) family protein